MESVESYAFVPAGLAITAMRDNGYKTTAHALAELIDNSVQAGARLVELFAVEERQTVELRQRLRVTELAVLDNGHGMSQQTLRRALMFGNGTHLQDRSGIGRFGMGLPASSISQCRRADVWSWQDGPDDALYTFIDLEQIEKGIVSDVPEPTRRAVPESWRRLSKGLGEAGTLVVWQDLDRVNWRAAKATLENTEFLIGRMYRRQIAEDGLVIRLAAVKNQELAWDAPARVNDPLYLMAPSMTPAPFDSDSMFQPWGETGQQEFSVPVEDKVTGVTTHHPVVVTLSMASEATLPDDGGDRGRMPYGKDARKNMGVSIMRAQRELVLDTSWINNDLRERWWGAEIEFPPELDEVFGVTNNKQAANNFSDLAAFYQTDAKSESDWTELREQWLEDGDPRYHLSDIANYLTTQLNSIRSRLRLQTAGRRSPGQKRHSDPGVEDRATKKFTQRSESGHTSEQEKPASTPEDTVEEVTEDLSAKGYSARDAREIAEAVADRDRKVIFVQQASDSHAFFSLEFLPGVTEVVFNTNHPAFEQLIEILSPGDERETMEGLRARINLGADTLKMLFSAWARFEMEERDGKRRDRVADMRHDWGRMAKVFLSDDDDDE
jgi:hypothetical protein